MEGSTVKQPSGRQPNAAWTGSAASAVPAIIADKNKNGFMLVSLLGWFAVGYLPKTNFLPSHVITWPPTVIWLPVAFASGAGPY